MALIVQKFGGTSVADLDRIRNVAEKVKKERELGNQVIVVVSAMSGVTNQLVDLAQKSSKLTTQEELAEYDSIVASGEQVSSGLLALTLMNMGIKSRSFLGWQAKITTESFHSKARINEIDGEVLLSCVKQGIIPIIAGFQGVDPNNRITTMGRGGSDTSAVAVAASVKADRCDIYTDVDGVYSSDPRIVSKARRLNKVGYEEMLEMSSSGAKVLQVRSVEMAMKHNVVVKVLSSLIDDSIGTLIINDEEIMERRLVTAVALDLKEARITLSGLSNHPGVSANIFGPLADNGINVDMIVQNASRDKDQITSLTFTIGEADVELATKVLEQNKDKIKYTDLVVDKNVAKVSVIGVGMKTHAGIAKEMFKTLSDKNINILVISTSEIKISVLIEKEYAELAARSLHSVYGLDKQD